MKHKIGLSSRLFLSHLLVMLVGVISLVIIGKISSPRFFVSHLEQLEGPGFTLKYARTRLIEGFEIAWNRSTFWAVIVGTTAAGGLSFWAAKRIMQPLNQMENITHKFAAGNLTERMPENEIPELNQLASSFNQMASSLQGVEVRRRELITDLTHELRTPLTIIRGYLEELAEGDLDPSSEIYDRLVIETIRLERLVNDLQELSKADSGYLPINLKPIHLPPLLTSLVEKFSSQLLDDDLVMKLDYPPNLPPVMADQDRLQQVLVNLIGNAMRYTSSGSIEVKSWGELERVWIAIVDTGKGISPDNLPHVFERFWRAEASQNHYPGGTGIGLAIARRLVELQGGKIYAESQLGVGSTFRFYLKIAR